MGTQTKKVWVCDCPVFGLTSIGELPPHIKQYDDDAELGAAVRALLRHWRIDGDPVYVLRAWASLTMNQYVEELYSTIANRLEAETRGDNDTGSNA